MSRKADVEEALETLAEMRAGLAITHAFKGFNIEPVEALELLKNKSDNFLTQEDKDKRERLIAAIDNLVEFSVCEEYQLFKELPENIDLDNNIAEYDELCEKYNKTYAAVENADIEYAMAIALTWLHYSEQTMLTYMTMGDDRVRPTHAQLEGFTARRDEFPAWMIPPIEYGCRCYLENSDGIAVAKINAFDKVPSKPKTLSNIFEESIAKCGRIFGKAHPYFEVNKNDKEKLKNMVNNIKAKYYV